MYTGNGIQRRCFKSLTAARCQIVISVLGHLRHLGHLGHTGQPFSTQSSLAVSSKLQLSPAQDIRQIVQRYSKLRLQDVQSILKAKGHDVEYDELVKLLLPPDAGDNYENEADNSDSYDLAISQTDRRRVQAKPDSLRKLRRFNPFLTGSKFSKTEQQKGAMQDERLTPPKIPEFSATSETRTLIEDFHKAAIHADVVDRIQAQWPKQQNISSDSVSDVVRQAIRLDMEKLSRPVLVNDPADYTNPYMSRQSTMRRILMKRATRNPGEEGVVDKILNEDPVLARLRSTAEAPPELLEPLLAFHGTTRYSFDPSIRLQQKLGGMEIALRLLDKLGPDAPFKTIMKSLPENIDTATLSQSHPFRHHLGFHTAEPVEQYQGSILMGKPITKMQHQLNVMRYPTLQRVAHNLPGDPMYRESVVRAIRLLERNKGWSFGKKIQFINKLKEVYSNLAPGQYYRQVLDLAIPMKKRCYMITKMDKRQKKGRKCRYFIPLHTIDEKKQLTAALKKK